MFDRFFAYIIITLYYTYMYTTCITLLCGDILDIYYIPKSRKKRTTSLSVLVKRENLSLFFLVWILGVSSVCEYYLPSTIYYSVVSFTLF